MTPSHPKPEQPADETSSDTAELMYVKCAACGNWMDVKPGQINSISHSLCADCYKAELRKLEQSLENR